MFRILILFCIGWMCCGIQRATAQARPEASYRVEFFTTVHGLPANRVYSVLIDRVGFIWIGTHNGLSRFDGYSFETFREAGPIGISPIVALYEDTEGDIWAGGAPFAPGGVSRLDRETGRVTLFKSIPGDPKSLLHNGVAAFHAAHDHPERLWVVAHPPYFSNRGGLGYFDTNTGVFTPWAPDGQIAERGTVMALLFDSTGDFWLGGAGLSRYDAAADTLESWLPDPRNAVWPYEGPQTDINYIQYIYEPPSERELLWLGGMNGLHRFSKQTHSFQTYFPFAGAVDDIRNRINAILEDRNGMLWVGTDGGLFTFDRERRQFAAFEEPSSIGRVYSIEEDPFGMIWVGSNNGLVKIERRVNPFRAYLAGPDAAKSIGSGRVGALLVDRTGKLWISTAGESGDLNLVDRTNGTVTRNPMPGVTSHFYQDKSGSIWTGNCNSGLLRYDPGNQARYRRYPQNPDDAQSLSLGCVNPVFEDSRNDLWVPVWAGGLDRLDRATGAFTHFGNDPQNPSSIGSDYVLRVYEDKAGVIWAGTEAGISRLNPDSSTFVNYDEDLLRRAMMLHEDRKGRFWVATANAGLHLFDREAGVVQKSVTTEDGLLSDIVWSVLEDDRGNLWLSSERSIARYNPDLDVLTTYTERDGIPAIQFNEASFYQHEDGELFFGGANGAVSFYPDQIIDNPLPPQVVLTQLRIADDPVEVGPDHLLTANLAATPNLTLSYEQNDIAIEFVGLHSIEPASNRYRYRLQGYDQNWVEAGTRRIARYPRLPPGDYTFQVLAASSDGVWNTEGTSLRIKILPPRWRSIAAFVLYGIMLVLFVAAVAVSQRRRMLRRALEESRERELIHARELQKAHTELQDAHDHLQKTQHQLIQQEKMASLGQLTAGIAHEIKNPLNFVNNFARLNIELLEELKERPDSCISDILDLIEDLQLNAEKINEHGVRADRIIQSMMRHASGAPGQRRSVDINTFVDEYINLAMHGRKDSVISKTAASSPTGGMPAIVRRFDETASTVTIVPQEIGQVLINLFNNAIDAMQEKHKHAPTDSYRPELTVSTVCNGAWVEIRVIDNGPGISRPTLDRVFEPFFTTKPSGSGTGLGLSLCYEIVTQGHGGMLLAESEAGSGSTFIIRLPA